MDQELRAKLAVAHAQQDWTAYAVLRAKIDEASLGVASRARTKDDGLRPAHTNGD